MKNYINDIPLVAFSGGVDSVAVAHFLSRKKKVTLLWIDHLTDHSAKSEKFVEEFARFYGMDLLKRKISNTKNKNESFEEFWRKQRLEIFAEYDQVITGHHLDDCVETWVWSSMHGEGKIPQCQINNVIRPFLLTNKENFIYWCKKRHIDWLEDESNNDKKYMRNYIRHEIIPRLQIVNPGLKKVVAKKVIKHYEDFKNER